jgi:hypothetical protein
METAQKVKAADEEIKNLKNSMHRARLVDSAITVRCGYKSKMKKFILFYKYLPSHQN